ncbi:conserved hypothetical protein [Trichinella spiralis]|uniref:hypothetical protein n=1 Tax=Trichinella spiralis TaxID=6334 RepID=UPI0001EFEF9D|nr:conserved hypothetical protein [Trichinella spiralis]
MYKRLWNGFTLINMNQQAFAFAARRLIPNTSIKRKTSCKKMISSNFIFNNLTCHFSSSVHDINVKCVNKLITRHFM